MIPHVIHYCWFGYNEKAKLIKKCIESWKKFHPDWEIIEWNEDNYDVNKIPYIQEAYKQKKWAFVVDFARFDILNQYGGVFLDTDVEFLKPIPEEYMEFEAFSGFESGRGGVAPGLIYAAEPNQKMLNKIIDEYSKRDFSTEQTIVDIVTSLLKEDGLVMNNQYQVVNGTVIFPQEYFCCFDHETQSFEITSKTISIHHYFASWSPFHRRAKYRIIKYGAKILGKERYKKLKTKLKRKIRR